MGCNLPDVKERLAVFMDYLKQMFPDAECELEFNSAYQLLVATILSAQCTDKQVNKVTPVLFNKYKDARSMANADLSDIESIIRSTGFYKNKARNILKASAAITERFGGDVPDNLEDLTSLPGVGRKTANVVLGNAFGVPGMVVDTHVKRITNRMGFTVNTDPEKIESDLMKIVPKDEWTMFSHRLILFGRKICDARKPNCEACKVSKICPSSRVI